MELTLFSKRAQLFLASPKFQASKAFSDDIHKKWLWEFTLLKNADDFQSDKILTLFYFNQSGSLLETLFLETLSHMVKGRDIAFLVGLGFREFENFLRDENHLPAFSSVHVVPPEESFLIVKNSLLVEIIKSEISSRVKNADLSSRWSQMSLTEKNLQAKSFILIINDLFKKMKPLELVLAEKEVLSIIKNDFPLGIDVIEELASLFLVNEEKISSLKVVAVQ